MGAVKTIGRDAANCLVLHQWRSRPAKHASGRDQWLLQLEIPCKIEEEDEPPEGFSHKLLNAALRSLAQRPLKNMPSAQNATQYQ